MGSRAGAGRAGRRRPSSRPSPAAPRAGIAGTRFAATVAALAAEPGALDLGAAGRGGDVPRAAARHRCSRPTARSAPGCAGSAFAGSARSRSWPRRRWWRDSARRGPASGLAPVARRSIRSGPAARRSGWRSACPSSPPSPSWRRSGSCSGASPSRSARTWPRAASPPSGAGCASSWISPSRRSGTPAELVVETRFPEPTADAEAIERLLLAKLERTPPTAAVARLELELDGASPAAGQQLPLFVPQALHGARLALAAGAPRADLRRGSDPARGDHRPRGAAARASLGLARRRDDGRRGDSPWPLAVSPP